MRIEKQNMQVLIVDTNKKPEIKRIPNRLEKMREIVGSENIGVIEHDDILIVFNEDAYKQMASVNRTIDNMKIRGTFIITGNDEYYKDFKDLTEEQIEKYTKEFNLEVVEQEEELE